MWSQKRVSLTKMPVFLMNLLLLVPGFVFLISGFLLHSTLWYSGISWNASLLWIILHFPWHFAESKVPCYFQNSVPSEVHESLTLTPVGCLGAYAALCADKLQFNCLLCVLFSQNTKFHCRHNLNTFVTLKRERIN